MYAHCIFLIFNKFLLLFCFFPHLQSVLRKEKLWKPKRDSFRPCHHRQVGGKSDWNYYYFWILSFMNLNSECWSLGLCRNVGFILSSRHDASSTCIFLFWLAFLGRSQNFPFWTCVSKSMMGFFSRCPGLSPIRNVWMVRVAQGCHLSYLAGQGLSRFPRRGSVPQVKWQPLYHSLLLLGLKTSDLDYSFWDYDKLAHCGRFLSTTEDCILGSVLYSEWEGFFGTRC